MSFVLRNLHFIIYKGFACKSCREGEAELLNGKMAFKTIARDRNFRQVKRRNKHIKLEMSLVFGGNFILNSGSGAVLLELVADCM